MSVNLPNSLGASMRDMSSRATRADNRLMMAAGRSRPEGRIASAEPLKTNAPSDESKRLHHGGTVVGGARADPTAT